MPEPKLAADSQEQFDQLQKKLVPLWKSIERFNQDPQTIVVVPSIVEIEPMRFPPLPVTKIVLVAPLAPPGSVPLN